MSPTERLTLIKALILWSLSSSDAIRSIIATSYKQNRHEDDLNQPLSVQPWGSDADKRRYYLIEGLDDTHFRVYRESNFTSAKRTWWSVAGEIDELKVLADKLDTEDGGQKAMTLSKKIMNAIPRFEETIEKRKRREYRQIRKQQFKRPESNYSIYEGRTRGKRMKYTYSDEEDESFSDIGSRRSARNHASQSLGENYGPTITLSGRQVKSRRGGVYGESTLSGTQTPANALEDYDQSGVDLEQAEAALDRPRRAAAGQNARVNGRSKRAGYNSADSMDSEDDDASEPDYGDDEEDDEEPITFDSDGQDDETSVVDEEMDEEDELQSLVVKLPVKTPTPEKKAMIGLRNSPEDNTTKSSMDAASVPGTSGSKPVGHDGSSPTLAKTSVVSNRIGVATVPKQIHLATAESEHVRDEDHRLQQSSSTPNPLSPLAFRGSPEKVQPFPTPAINVGSSI